MTVATESLHLLNFVSKEHENFLVSLVNNKDDLQIYNQLQGLYNAVLRNMTSKEDDQVIFQLLILTHYHLLYSTANMMRCHLSDAYASVRIAVDAALIASCIIEDRSLQVAYAKREKPFDKLNRHLKNLIKANKPLPHRLIPELIKIHDHLSSFASHADVNTFFHRYRQETKEDGTELFGVEYFQFSRDADERQIHSLNLFHAFVMILDVFSGFLVNEVKRVPQAWKQQLYSLGKKMEQHAEILRKRVNSDSASNEHEHKKDDAG